MTQTYSTRQAARATGATRYQIDAWVSNGYFRPRHRPAPGEGRRYDFDELIALAVVVDLVDFGLSPDRAATFVRNLHSFKSGPAVLAIVKGQVEVLAPAARGETSKRVKAWLPDAPPIARIVRSTELAAMIEDREIRVVAALNLDHVERRVKEALAAEGAD